MPVTPNFWERTAFNTLNIVPGMMLDLAGMLAMQAVTTAVELNIFTTLAQNGVYGVKGRKRTLSTRMTLKSVIRSDSCLFLL